MAALRYLLIYFRQYGLKHKVLFVFSFMILFWALFDGIMSYIAPLVITESGLSKTLMGIIIGSSSIAGALFDFIVCMIFKDTAYRRVFLIMFAMCFVYPLILWSAKGFSMYLIAMALWGFYYDLKNFGNFDFVGHEVGAGEHSVGFGFIQVFQSLGYLFAPILAGFIIGELVDWKPFILAWVFLAISFIFFLVLIMLSRRIKAHKRSVMYQHNSFSAELRLWRKIGKLILPLLIMTMLLNIADAFFWTVGPLLAESFTSLRQFAGFFMAAYSLPALLVGWFVGPITLKLGKKRAAFLSFLVGSAILSSISLSQSPIFMMAVVFFSSCLVSIAWPALSGAYADYISESAAVEKEIEGLEDCYTNVGYIIGPVIAGFLADRVGNAETFSILGVIGVVSALILMKITPKSIDVCKTVPC